MFLNYPFDGQIVEFKFLNFVNNGLELVPKIEFLSQKKINFPLKR